MAKPVAPPDRRFSALPTQGLPSYAGHRVSPAGPTPHARGPLVDVRDGHGLRGNTPARAGHQGYGPGPSVVGDAVDVLLELGSPP